MYNDKLPDMSAAYAEIQEKMAKKDHDGDGKIETGKEAVSYTHLTLPTKRKV